MNKPITLGDLFNEDGTFSPLADQHHQEAYKKICAENDKNKKNKEQGSTYELPYKNNTEIELYPNGSLKRYKY